MALPPKFAGQMVATGGMEVKHTLELCTLLQSSLPRNLPSPSLFLASTDTPTDLDYVCPFSAKMFNTIHTHVSPLIKKKYTDPGVRIIFRQQIQPWHPSSTLVHESGAAILRLAPAKFWDFSKLLFEHQKDYFDVNVVNETRNETYKRLAKLAGEVEGVSEEKVYEMLEVGDKAGKDEGLNIGNRVTDDVKLMVKANRVIGAHVTPTVFFNGVEEKSIGSSWGKGEWEEWLEKNVT